MVESSTFCKIYPFFTTINVSNRKEQFLLFRIRAFKDPQAFRLLLDEHGSSIQRFLHFKLKRREDAEDAYTTTCLRTWDYLTRSSVEFFSALLYTIARGVVADFYRTHSHKADLSIEDLPNELAVDHQTELDSKVDLAMMKQALQQLPDDDREAILMRYLEGYSVREIAHQLGKQENATSVLIHRGLKKLRKIIEHREGKI